MIKFKLFFDKDKETQWLNDMADQGWAMKSFCAGFYSFEPCEKGEYRYQIDFGDRFFQVSNDYRSFMNEAGIEVVQTWGFWVMLRKLAADGDFQLYTDVDSQLEHYTKILLMFKVVTIIELLALFMEIFAAIESGSPLLYGLACLIAALVITFVRITFHTSDIVSELKERKTGIAAQPSKTLSPYLTFGLLCNSIALLTQDAISSWIRLPIQLAAIALMLTGIYQTARNQRK